jgi:predicted ATPase
LEQFGADILQMDLARYRETPVADQPVFFDGGIPGALCFLDQLNALPLEKVEEYVRSFPYNKDALVMPPWKEIYRVDSERDQTFPESVQVFESLMKWYARWGYKTIEAPRTTIDHRVSFILQTVEDPLTRDRLHDHLIS